MSEEIYLYRLKGLEKCSSCTRQRYLDYKLKDYLYEVKVVHTQEERKPLDADLICQAFEDTGFTSTDYRLRCFIEGVRWAEEQLASHNENSST